VNRREFLLGATMLGAGAGAARAQVMDPNCFAEIPPGRFGRRMVLPAQAEIRPCGNASLDLNFLAGALDSRITFTRASTATYFDATGTMQTAATNVPRFDNDPVLLTPLGLLIEEARTNISKQSGSLTGYGLTGATLTLAAGLAPDGTTSMTKLAEDGSTGVHFTWVNSPTTASTTYTFSAYAMAAEDRYLQLRFDDGGSNGGYATFDLVAGTITGAQTVVGAGVLSGAWIQAVGRGIFRCAIANTISTGTTCRGALMLSNAASPAGSPSYAGTVGNGVLVWGTQIEAGAFATSYIPVPAAAAVTRAADVATMPTGAWFSPSAGTFAADASVYTTSATHVNLEIVGFGTDINNCVSTRIPGGSANVGTSAFVGGTIQGTATGLPAISGGATFKAAANYVLATLTVNCATNSQMGTPAVMSALPASYSGVGIGGGMRGNPLNGYIRRVRYWPRALSNTELQAVTTITDPSLDISFLTGPLIPAITFTRASTATYFDVTGTLQTAATNAPRFDNDPSLLTPLGLLIEEARTNSTRNSTMVGAVPGTPGTPPTNWGQPAVGGALTSVQLVGTGTDGGIPYIDYAFVTNAAITFEVSLDGSFTASANGQLWSGSLFAKLMAGSNTNIAHKISIYELGGLTNGNNTTFVPNATWQRVSVTRTNSSTGTTNQSCRYTATVSGAASWTIRIGAPQLELGAFSTSYIPTTGAVVTRAADVATMALPPGFSGTLGSWAADFVLEGITSTAAGPRIIGSANNAGVGLAYVSSAFLGATFDGNAVLTTANQGTINVTTKVGSTISCTAGTVCLNGGVVASGALPTGFGATTSIKLGSDANSDTMNGRIRRVRYWPRALSNIELQQVTT
jgi:hypothetical protein